jgi:WXG100 family type VII secretion target
MDRIGASMEAMDTLKTSFDNQAQAVQTLQSDLEGQVSMISNNQWEGPAAQRFLEAWNSKFRPALNDLHMALSDAGAEVAQRRAAIAEAGG